MSTHFEKVTIKQVRKETEDCVSILFDIPEHLKTIFSYLPGQHISLRTKINDEEIRRSYSLCSSPAHNEWRIAVKKVEGGIFSAFANHTLQEGDYVEIMPPAGHFVLPETNEAKSYVCFAAGSGITPVLSIIKTGLLLQPKSNFTLVYGNRNSYSIIFKEEIEALKNKYIDRLQLVHVFSREQTESPLNEGRIDAAKCEQLFKSVISLNADDFFICGPQEMIFTIKDWLLKKQVPEKKIHFELFNTVPLSIQKEKIKKDIEADVLSSHVKLILDGRSFEFDLPYEAESVLDAALKQGADLPYACKGGVCTTCKAKLLEGEVEMVVNYGLEAEETEQGFILTCQSHPRTNKLLINFDMK